MSGYRGGSSLWGLIGRFLLSILFLLQIAVELSTGQSVTRDSSGGSVPRCYTFDCGDGVPIGYPLWNSSESGTGYCGYRNLGIQCQGRHPVLRLGEDTYRVSGVNYSSSTITLIDGDLLGSKCPRARHNLTLPEGLKDWLAETDADGHLLFFFNCSSGGSLTHEHRISCLPRNGSKENYVLLADQGNTPESYPRDCEDIVKSTVLETAVRLIVGNLLSAFGDVLHRGFQLKWRPYTTNCVSCEREGGRCGYGYNQDAGAYDLLCIRNNGTILAPLPPPPPPRTGQPGINKPRKIAIGVGAGVGGFLLACVLCFLVYRRKRMGARTGSSTLLFRTASSEPPSQKDPEVGSTHYYPTHVFKYEELSEATEGFSEANELGDGGFGTVYKGKLRDGRIVAVKRLYENNYKRVEQFMNEVAILNRLQHPNLVTLYGCTSRHSRELLLVYEYVPNGTVADHLHGDRAVAEGWPPLGWPVRLSIAVETATALAYLHKVEPPIIHRDVKTNNILLDDNFHVKVADFGLSRLFPTDATHVSTAPQGTPGYVDPEYHQCYQLTDKSDVYSFGVVLAELISSKPAVDITRHRHEINLANMAVSKIQSGELRELVDPVLEFETDRAARRMIELVAELAFRCLQAEKEMRPCMEHVAEVLRGILRGSSPSPDEAAAYDHQREGETDHGDDASLLKNNKNAPFSPDSVMDKWTSRTTTPNTSV